MKRRNFMLGFGATVAAGGTVLGSGAFSSVEADRDVTVSVAGDANAFLRIAPTNDPNGAYALEDDDGSMYLDFTGESDDIDGSGLNPEAVTGMAKVFEIANQGTQEVSVTLEPGTGTNATAIMPQSINPPGNQEVLLVITAHNPGNDGYLADPSDPLSAINLPTGESKKFSITATVSSDLSGSSAIEQDKFTINAEAI